MDTRMALSVAMRIERLHGSVLTVRRLAEELFGEDGVAQGYDRTKKFIDVLVKTGMLDRLPKTSNRNYYEWTNKGIQFFELYWAMEGNS